MGIDRLKMNDIRSGGQITITFILDYKMERPISFIKGDKLKVWKNRQTNEGVYYCDELIKKQYYE